MRAFAALVLVVLGGAAARADFDLLSGDLYRAERGPLKGHFAVVAPHAAPGQRDRQEAFGLVFKFAGTREEAIGLLGEWVDLVGEWRQDGLFEVWLIRAHR